MLRNIGSGTRCTHVERSTLMKKPIKEFDTDKCFASITGFIRRAALLMRPKWSSYLAQTWQS